MISTRDLLTFTDFTDYVDFFMIDLTLVIENKTDFKTSTKKAIKDCVIDVLKEKGIEGEIEVGLIIVEKSEIQYLNKQYRQKDYPTDVLSFPIFDKVPQNNPVPILIGDIIICPTIMKENADRFGVSYDTEFNNLIKHSTLHLLGYHHKGDE